MSKNKIISASDLNSKLNSMLFKTHINNRLIKDEDNELNNINEFLKNNTKCNRMYNKRNTVVYKNNNDDEQFDFDLRQFINSKIKKNNKKNILPRHHRSNSTNIYNY